MIFIDTHTHLYLSDFDADRDEIIKKAINSGVRHCILPNIDLESIELMEGVYRQYPNFVSKLAGLHPTSVKSDPALLLSGIKEMISDAGIAGIGECGLDMYWDTSNYENQKMAFSTQINWSLETGLPLSIHIRDAYSEVFEVLDSFGSTKFSGVFHCFSGGVSEAFQAIERGFMLGIGGVVTFKNSKLREILKEVPPEKVVLETDAPFLAPAPYRGKRNEPSLLLYIAEELSRIWGVSLATVAEVTTANALNTFKKIKL